MSKFKALILFGLMNLIGSGLCFATEIGEVAFFSSASTICPAGWLSANAGSFSNTTYPALATRMGCSGGGCQTPQLGGYFIRGWTANPYTDSTRVRNTTQSDSFQGHNHTVVDPGHNHPTANNDGPNNIRAAASGNSFTTAYPVGTKTTGITVTAPISNGTNGTPRIDSETRPVNISLLACIRALDEVTLSTLTYPAGGSMVSTFTLVAVSSTVVSAFASQGIFDYFNGADLSFWLGIIVACFVVMGFKTGSK